MAVWPFPDPDPWWHVFTALVMLLALLVIVVAAIGLAYGFLLDYFDRDFTPDTSGRLERLRKLPDKPQ